jgi:hypothetical protein
MSETHNRMHTMKISPEKLLHHLTLQYGLAKSRAYIGIKLQSYDLIHSYIASFLQISEARIQYCRFWKSVFSGLVEPELTFYSVGAWFV